MQFRVSSLALFLLLVVLILAFLPLVWCKSPEGYVNKSHFQQCKDPAKIYEYEELERASPPVVCTDDCSLQVLNDNFEAPVAFNAPFVALTERFYGQGSKILTVSNRDLVRYNQDGTIDTTFGTNGYFDSSVLFAFLTSINPPPLSTPEPFNQLRELIITDNFIYLTCSCTAWIDPTTPIENFLLVRLSPDGILDTSYGNSGFVAVNLDNPIILPDGRVISRDVSNPNFFIEVSSDGLTVNLQPLSVPGFLLSNVFFVSIKRSDTDLYFFADLDAQSQFAVVKTDFNFNIDSSYGVNGAAIFDVTTFDYNTIGISSFTSIRLFHGFTSRSGITYLTGQITYDGFSNVNTYIFSFDQNGVFNNVFGLGGFWISTGNPVSSEPYRDDYFIIQECNQQILFNYLDFLAVGSENVLVKMDANGVVIDELRFNQNDFNSQISALEGGTIVMGFELAIPGIVLIDCNVLTI